jgi:Rsm1-like
MDEQIQMLPPDFLQPEETYPVATDLEAADQQSQEDLQGSPEFPGRRINRAAFALAFFGWDVVGDGSTGLVECRACFRRLGLWMYKRKENGDVTVYQKLIVAEEHMDYCPWVNPRVQSGAGKITERVEDFHDGWELLAQAIRTKHRRRVRSMAPPERPSKDPETVSIGYSAADEETRNAKNKEWWSKLRRVRQALSIKSAKKPVPISQ